MTEKKSAHKPPTEDSIPKKAPKHEKGTSEGGFWNRFMAEVVAHIIVLSLVSVGALVSGSALLFLRDPDIFPLSSLILVVLTIVFAYMALISLQFFFQGDFFLNRKIGLHITLSLLIVIIVTTPVVLVTSYSSSRFNEQRKNLTDELEIRRAADSRRIQLYSMVTESMTRLLRKANIDSKDLNELLNFCVQSLLLNKHNVNDLRAAAVYANKSDTKLRVPEGGYFGTGFDREIEGLEFDVSPQAKDESQDKYRERIGVAGYCYREKKFVLEIDITKENPGRPYIYKPFEPLQRGNPDRALICVCIPDMTEGRENGCVGVLSVSSMSPGVLDSNDLAVVRFFSTLLGRFKIPLEDPPPKSEERK